MTRVRRREAAFVTTSAEIVTPETRRRTPRPVALLFPGTGAQYRRMAAGLYGAEPVFTAAMDEVFDALGADGTVIRRDWLAERPVVAIDANVRSQPLLFAVDYALGRTVMSWGIRPAALLGHSMGEFAAATLAGVFELREAVRLMWERVLTLGDAPSGGMLVVAASPVEVAPYLIGGVVIGAVNAPRQVVLSGLAAPLAAVAQAMEADGRTCRVLASGSPFHSPAMAPLAATGEPLFAAARLSPPRTTLYSAYLGGELPHERAVDPRFWAGQPAAPVLFWPALDTLLATGDHVLVETGPGPGLASLARGHAAVRTGGSEVVSLLPARPRGAAEDRQALATARTTLTPTHRP